jgi:hypothetical protein
MTHAPVAPPVQLSAPPSAYRLPDDFNLDGAFGSLSADRVAVVIVVYSQRDDCWQTVAHGAIPGAVEALVRQARDESVILFFLDSPSERVAGVGQMIEDGYLEWGTAEVEGKSVVTVFPTEKFLEPLAPYRV